MLNIQFKPGEECYMDLQNAFNEILEVHYPKCLEWNHYELWNNSNQLYTPQDWKEFRLDQRVSEWFHSEMAMMVENRTFKLISKVGDTRSTADISALSQMLNYLKEQENNRQNKVITVYAFVPLNESERQAPNVRVLESVPVEIKNAIQYLQKSRDE